MIGLDMVAYPFLVRESRLFVNRHDMPPPRGRHQLSGIAPRQPPTCRCNLRSRPVRSDPTPRKPHERAPAPCVVWQSPLVRTSDTVGCRSPQLEFMCLSHKFRDFCVTARIPGFHVTDGYDTGHFPAPPTVSAGAGGAAGVVHAIAGVCVWRAILFAASSRFCPIAAIAGWAWVLSTSKYRARCGPKSRFTIPAPQSIRIRRVEARRVSGGPPRARWP